MNTVTIVGLVIAAVVVIVIIVATMSRRRPVQVQAVTGGIEQVVVLWDKSSPTNSELAKIVEQALPGRRAHELRIERANNPSLSYGLANWHVYQDEHTGIVTPGAWRRAQQGPILNTSHGRRLVSVVPAPPNGQGAHVPAARHEWAHEPILRHVARIELDMRPELMDRAAWRRMISPAVLDFVLGVDADLIQHGRLAGQTRRFGDLDVVVSLAGLTDPAQIRTRLLPGGYLSTLDTLLRESGIRLDESDVAHWILCRGKDDEDTMVHLSYLPPRGTSPHMAWDLLSAEERRGGRKLG